MNDRATTDQKHKRNRNFRKPLAPSQDKLFNLEQLAKIAGHQVFNNICTAQVISVNGEVSVQIKGLADFPELMAKIPSEEFGENLPAIGSEISIYLEDPPKTKIDGTKEIANASFLKANELSEWNRVEEALKQKAFVKGMVVGVIKGGFSVALFAQSKADADAGLGLRAFLPHRQAGFSAKDLPSVFSEEPFDFSLLEVAPDSGSIIITRRDVLHNERKAQKKEFWDHVKVGDVVEGVVRNLMPYGAFVEVNGADGLLHASDLVWHKQPRPEEILTVGQVLSLQVIEADVEKRKLKLGLKQLTSDPWESIREHFRTGMEVEGTVVAIADFGVFVRLQDGIEGLIHLSEMSWQKFKHPSQKFRIGDTVKSRILSLDQGHHRISLSTKAMEPNPVERIAEKFPAGTVIRTKIAQVKDFGLFVEVDPTIMGLVHIGEISWTKHVEHPGDFYSEGAEVEVVVLGFDPERQRVSCSIKRLTEDPWVIWKDKYAKGTRHQITIKKVVNAGAECELEPDLIAFCTTKELSSQGADRAQEVVKVGQTLEIEVLNCDPQHQKISVSAKARAEKEIREDYEQYLKKQNQSGDAKVTMADAMADRTSKV